VKRKIDKFDRAKILPLFIISYVVFEEVCTGSDNDHFGFF